MLTYFNNKWKENVSITGVIFTATQFIKQTNTLPAAVTSPLYQYCAILWSRERNGHLVKSVAVVKVA